MFNNTRNGVKYNTTFDEWWKWEEKHPLYKCTKCNGYDINCKGYKPLENE